MGGLNDAVVVKAGQKRIVSSGLGESIALLVEDPLDMRMREDEVCLAVQDEQWASKLLGTLAMVLLLPLVHLRGGREIGSVEVHIIEGHVPKLRDGDVQTPICRELGNLNEFLGGVFGEIERWEETGNGSKHVRDEDLLEWSAFGLFNDPRD